MKYYLINIDLMNYDNIFNKSKIHLSHKNRIRNAIKSVKLRRLFPNIPSINQSARTLNEILNSDEVMEDYYYNVL